MSNRERWIVYPLLFLALGTALRDKITRSIGGLDAVYGKSVQIDLNQGIIQCRALEVVDESGQRRVLVATDGFAGQGERKTVGAVHTYGDDGRQRCHLGLGLQCRELRVVGSNGLARVFAGETAVTRPGGAKLGAGVLRVSGYNGMPVMALETDSSGASGVVQIGRVNGQSDLVLAATPVGGIVTILDSARSLSLILGHVNDTLSGLFAENAEGQTARLTPPVQRIAPLPQEGRPPEPEGV
jgi:hypothetical protein